MNHDYNHISSKEFANLFKNKKKNREDILLGIYGICQRVGKSFAKRNEKDKNINVELIEDMIQDSFIYASKKINKVHRKENPFSYFFTMIVNFFAHSKMVKNHRAKLWYDWAETLRNDLENGLNAKDSNQYE